MAFLRSPESYFIGLLKSCSNLTSLQQIHSSLTTSGIIKIPNLGIQILIQYAKFGKPYIARSLLDSEIHGGKCGFLPWNIMIRAFANGGFYVETLDLYSIMRKNGISRNNYTFPFALKACASRLLIVEGKFVHGDATKTGFSQDLYVEAALLDMYIKCGQIDDGRKVFDEMSVRDFICWTGMITAYRRAERPEEALALFKKMLQDGVFVDSVSIVSAAAAVAQLGDAMRAQMVHAHAIRTGFSRDLYVEAALVAMYAKCGEIHHGRRVFNEMPIKDLVCWTGMITACEQAEQPEEALVVFQEMQQNGVFADAVSIVSVAAAIGQLGDTLRAQTVHAQAICNGFLKDVSVGNAVISMYAKCGNVAMARLVFDLMEKRDGISWNSMLSGYTQNGRASEALLLFDEMVAIGCNPGPVTVLIMVSACAYLGSKYLGRKLHDFITDSRIKVDANLQNALMDMYAKCGELDTVLKMFNDIHPSEWNVSLWNVVISGYGTHGYGKEALETFSQMVQEGIEPDHITFTSLLSACSHAGLIDEGRKLFSDMKKFCITPHVKHYSCMVDMLGRAGLLNEAFDLIRQMPSSPDDDIWGALLLACRIHGNTELGEIAANNLLQLEPKHSGYYVLMSNIYAASNRWQEALNLRHRMKNRGLKKPAAFSVIEFGKEVHGFHTADRVHPCWPEVYRKIESLEADMKVAGYRPDLSCVLHDMEEEDKEHSLKYHSEKLAVAFGIMKMGEGIAIQVTNNLRICNDCHSAFKLISFIHRRKIIVRDANRFHHFHHGACSCKDYW